jgi:hypothetical protein
MPVPQHVVALRVDHRCEFAPHIQEILTAAGCRIEVRLGVHSMDMDDNNGLILLVARGSEEDRDALCELLGRVPDVKVSCMAAPE